MLNNKSGADWAQLSDELWETIFCCLRGAVNSHPSALLCYHEVAQTELMQYHSTPRYASTSHDAIKGCPCAHAKPPSFLIQSLNMFFQGLPEVEGYLCPHTTICLHAAVEQNAGRLRAFAGSQVQMDCSALEGY